MTRTSEEAKRKAAELLSDPDRPLQHIIRGRDFSIAEKPTFANLVRNLTDANKLAAQKEPSYEELLAQSRRRKPRTIFDMIWRKGRK